MMDLSKLQLNMFDIRTDELVTGKVVEGFGKTKGTVFDRGDDYVFRVYDETGTTIFNRKVNKQSNLQSTLEIIKNQYGIQF